MIVIPADLSLTENEAILDLQTRVNALESLLQCIDPTSNSAQFRISGCIVEISSPSQIDLVIGANAVKMNDTSITIDAASVDVDGSAVLRLKGGVILGNTAAAPIARVGDTVQVDPASGTGTIQPPGNPTVLF